MHKIHTFREARDLLGDIWEHVALKYFPCVLSCKRLSIFAPADIVEGIEGASEELDRELGVPLRTHAVATIKELKDKVRAD